MLAYLVTISPFFIANRALIFVEEPHPSVVSCCSWDKDQTPYHHRGPSMAGPTPVQPHRPQVPTTYILLIPWRCDALPLCPTARGGLCTGCSLFLDLSFLSSYTDLCSNTTSSWQFSVYLRDDLLVAISILYSKLHQAGTMSVSFFLVSAASSPMPGYSRYATNT